MPKRCAPDMPDLRIVSDDGRLADYVGPLLVLLIIALACGILVVLANR